MKPRSHRKLAAVPAATFAPPRPIVKSVGDRMTIARLCLIQAQACTEVALRQNRDSIDSPMRFHIESEELCEAARHAIQEAAAQVYWIETNPALSDLEAPNDDQREEIEHWEQANAKAGAR